MITISAVRGWPLDELEVMGTRLQLNADSLAESVGSAMHAMDSDPDWSGATHDAAGARLAHQRAVSDRVSGLLESAARSTNEFAAQAGQERNVLLAYVAEASEHGYLVDDDGTVHPPADDDGIDAAYYSGHLRQRLAQLGAADDRFAAQLRPVAEALTGEGRAFVLPGGTAGGPDRALAALLFMSPERRRDYLSGFTPAELQRLAEYSPGLVGNLDGVPFTVRAAANRISIEHAREEAAADPDLADRAELLGKLLAPDEDGNPRTFITFREDGRYIEQIGAIAPGIEGAAVLVPGTGTGLHSNEGDRGRAAALAEASGSPVFLYVDGFLPQDIAPPAEDLAAELTAVLGFSVATGNPSRLAALAQGELESTVGTAMHGGQARAMAPGLVDFGRELDAELAARAPGTQTTFIGHSYGGSVLGTAEQLGLRADRVVYASSAGTGAGDGEWANRNPDVQRYSLTAPGDPIQLAQKYGASVHGGDPDSAPGVRRLDTGHYSDGGLVAGPDGHSKYLNDTGSTAFENIVAVITGDETSGYVERAPDIDIPDMFLTQSQQDALDTVLDAAKDMLDLPDIPGVPDLPDWLEFVERPGVPSIPGAPGIPLIPQIPLIPGIPGNPILRLPGMG